MVGLAAGAMVEAFLEAFMVDAFLVDFIADIFLEAVFLVAVFFAIFDFLAVILEALPDFMVDDFIVDMVEGLAAGAAGAWARTGLTIATAKEAARTHAVSVRLIEFILF